MKLLVAVIVVLDVLLDPVATDVAARETGLAVGFVVFGVGASTATLLRRRCEGPGGFRGMPGRDVRRVIPS